MKILTVIFLLFCFALYGQEKNPDGQKPSIHFTPMTSWGNVDINSGTQKIGSSDYPSRFEFQLLLKIPTSNKFTISIFFSSANMNYNFTPEDTSFLDEHGTGKIYKMGSTLSYYF